MDNFGVLVQNYGIKPQGKSAPMSSSQKSHNLNSNSNPKIQSFFNNNNNINNIDNNDDDIFGLNSGKKSDIFDDVFKIPTENNNEGEVNIENMFMGSVSLNPNPNPVDGVNDDVIWGFNGSTSGGGGVVGGNNGSKDLLSSDPVDDFLGSLGNLGNLGSGSGGKVGDLKKSGVGDDLLAGFGRSFTTNGRAQASTQKSAGTSYLDELEEFASSKVKRNATMNFDASRIRNELNKTSKNKSHETNFFDIGGSSHVNSIPRSGMERESEVMFQTDATDLDSFFSAHSQSNKPVSKDKFVSKDKPVSKEKPDNRKTMEVPDLFFGNTSNVKKTPSSSFGDDFSSIFGGSPSVGRFEEVEGESEERRKARFERYQRTEARMVEALVSMNQREYKAQQEQEERHRIAEAMDMEMKRWVAGKEGNLRALLSSLQQVLGSEFGWRPVNLTDLITSSQVKIAYKKAALCVHPDKVQQRGASLQQKYVAEKVFDLLKEAWNKFNAEELR